ncbi:OTU protein [Recurvomyces mirabilis]|nr:OTU protein [Recurvomyces mirabilis]
MEGLQAKHRKEQKDLQSRITQKKKQASKKTRKGVNDECEKLEAELKERQAEEIAVLNGEVDEKHVEPPSKDLEALTIDEAEVNGETKEQDGGEEHASGQDHVSEDSPSQQGKKPNRAKARLARRAAEQEELVRQAAAEAKNLPDLKTQERSRMLAATKEKGLREEEIRADGHCLYSAIADQLSEADVSLSLDAVGSNDVPAYKTVRAVAAHYISQHPDDFAPFLEEPLKEYVHKIRDTAEWGGQLELLALAKSYSVDINVLQDFGRVEKISVCGKLERDERGFLHDLKRPS